MNHANHANCTGREIISGRPRGVRDHNDTAKGAKAAKVGVTGVAESAESGNSGREIKLRPHTLDC